MNETLNVPTMAEMMAQGKTPEVLFWVGCAGSFDDRAKKVIRAFASLLIKAKVDFAVLGTEESCTGDPAKRSGNEFLFQMQAMTNIEVLNAYGVKKIVTTCPHCFNTLKNEYPSLGGNYQVLHHTQFLQSLLQEGRLRVSGGEFKGKKITFHDPCYLGRANDQYEAPRELLKELEAEVVEMKSCKSRGLCCGAGGAQMFKEPEKGNQDINVLRTQQAIDTQAKIIAVGCPFCNTMLTDGVKNKEQEKQIKVLDLAELLNNSII
ncbi:(Fe-S)-binding protein [Capnocytophaga canimorsus]|uniref:CoB--CoM heterodisulfide reductase n=1 Tax=Capnocytophaga canimorsus TaxID=28188 RepID=A0A0B7IIK3_9FLAO|nr:(Fe-S)-binding protein [Capnocytophaga canimorsus]ATA91386.1 CoB--CoM heterodisulfide reductase [Capnocytophaga canimorsus]CEN49803.1 putative CoB--CoM heterodisulfide reductase [Capnocytophaga canimorsus]VEJ18858.1 succinate dehydrogenase/fumarate reductase iron-sulfur subunit [Capnocytophaga canimorsus]GIM55872.1 Fe-S oxidoreductase [Capnocytophaga canimorsus]GIM59411.1 Fe-S oxidoreductase [Capnocytophaga canimorsus]